MNNEISSSFIINSGLKQEDVMSPLLINVALESVIKKIPQAVTLTKEMPYWHM